MVVFSKLLFPVDELSHTYCTKPQLSPEDTTTTEPEPLDDSDHQNEVTAEATDQAAAENVAELHPKSSNADPRKRVIDELTIKLSTTFRLEEKVIETESQPEEPGCVPLSSSTNTSSSDGHETKEAEEGMVQTDADSTDPIVSSSPRVSQHEDRSSDTSETMSPATEEEKKDDSHDAHVVLSRLEFESRKNAEEEIERILQQERGVDEDDTPVKSDAQNKTLLSLEQTQPNDPATSMEKSSQSLSQHDVSEGSLADFASAKGELSVPNTPERPEVEFKKQHDVIGEDNDQNRTVMTSKDGVDTSVPVMSTTDQLQSSDEKESSSNQESEDHLETDAIDVSANSTIKSILPPSSPSEDHEDEHDIQESAASELIDKATLNGNDLPLPIQEGESRNGANGEDTLVVRSESVPVTSSSSERVEAQSIDVPSQPSTSGEFTMATPQCEQSTGECGLTSAEDSVSRPEATQMKETCSQVSESTASEQACAIANLGSPQLEEMGANLASPPNESIETTAQDVETTDTRNEPNDYHSKTTAGPINTGQGSDAAINANECTVNTAVYNIPPAAKIKIDEYPDERSCLSPTIAGCLSDDSGVVEPSSANSDGASVGEAISPQFEKKKKSFFGKLKKKLIPKDHSPTKSTLSPSQKNSPNESALDSPLGQSLPPAVPDLHDQVEQNDNRRLYETTQPNSSQEGFCFQHSPQAQRSHQSREHIPLPNSEQDSRPNDSILVTPASQALSRSGSIQEFATSPAENTSPYAPKRLTMQASNEVAHVFRPPRPSSAGSTPVHSRAPSPHTSQGPSPGSSQMSISSSGHNRSQPPLHLQMQPHLPALAGPRESYHLPPQPRKESATRAMTRLIRKDLWSNDQGQVEAALRYLADVASDSDKVALIARTGGLLAIVNCMEQHTLHAGIQIAACNALEKLALDSDNELAIGEVGGVEAIQGAMMTHFGDTNVQEAAWSALWNLSCGNADCSSLNHAGLVSFWISQLFTGY